MDEIIEILLELIVEGGIEISGNKKISKWIRYPIITIIILFFTLIIGLFFFLGISILNENIQGGIIAILIGIILLVLGIIKGKEKYLEIKNKTLE